MRIALTKEDFAKQFPEINLNDEPDINHLVKPMVFMCYRICESEEEFIKHFSDLEDGLSESDIESENFAQVIADQSSEALQKLIHLVVEKDESKKHYTKLYYGCEVVDSGTKPGTHVLFHKFICQDMKEADSPDIEKHLANCLFTDFNNPNFYFGEESLEIPNTVVKEIEAAAIDKFVELLKEKANGLRKTNETALFASTFNLISDTVCQMADSVVEKLKSES